MCKAMNKGIRIQDLHLVSKTGGKSGDYHASHHEIHHDSLHGLVLAGGRSTRMGPTRRRWSIPTAARWRAAAMIC